MEAHISQRPIIMGLRQALIQGGIMFGTIDGGTIWVGEG